MRCPAQHPADGGDILGFKVAHPTVVTEFANCLNGDFGVWNDFLSRASELKVKRLKILAFMNPFWPEMFFASRVIVTEKAEFWHAIKVSRLQGLRGS